MKSILLTIVGLTVTPVFWLLQKIGLVKPLPKLSPAFEALNSHLFQAGLSGVGEMQPLTLNNVREVASLRFGFDPTKFHIVTLTLSEDEAAAALVEAEVRGAPQFTGINRNDRFVMACTFSPPNPNLERELAQAFMSYRHGI